MGGEKRCMKQYEIECEQKISDLEAQNKRLCDQLAEQTMLIGCKDAQIDELKKHIECLQAELQTPENDDMVELPLEPIKVADMLISLDREIDIKVLGTAHRVRTRYTDRELKQIAEHLLVYCNNSEGD